MLAFGINCWGVCSEEPVVSLGGRAGGGVGSIPGVGFYLLSGRQLEPSQRGGHPLASGAGDKASRPSFWKGSTEGEGAGTLGRLLGAGLGSLLSSGSASLCKVPPPVTSKPSTGWGGGAESPRGTAGPRVRW